MSQHIQPQPGVVAHALTALGHHIGKYELPVPGQVSIETDHLALTLVRGDARAWRQSLGRDVKVAREPAIRGSRLEYVTLSGLLPDSGVRVAVSWLRETRRVQAATA